MFRTFCLSVVVAGCLLAPSTSEAFWPYAGYGFGYGGWGWGNIQPTNYVPAPPYYAIYPPVYYSHQITARHYGASPFAWMPGMQPITYVPQPVPMRRAPAAVSRESLFSQTQSAAEAVVITNPFVEQAQVASEAAQPRKIDNPFVASVSR